MAKENSLVDTLTRDMHNEYGRLVNKCEICDFFHVSRGSLDKIIASSTIKPVRITSGFNAERYFAVEVCRMFVNLR